MKHTIKKMKIILYFCLAIFLLNSCTQEKEFLEQGNRDIKFSRKPFKELLSIKDFDAAYEKVKNEKQKNITSRSAIEDEYNFSIVEDKDVKIIEVENKTFYNILIERNYVSPSYFENLFIMVEKINNIDEVSAYIIKYSTSNGLMAFVPENDKEITQLFGRFLQNCSNVCVPMCIKPWHKDIACEAHPMSSNDCVNSFQMCFEVCHDIYIPDGGGGDVYDHGNNSSGGGGAGATPPSTSPPPINGATGAAPPPELIINPVDEVEQKKTPCSELAKLSKPRKNPLPSGSVKISDAIEVLENNSSLTDIHENGFQFRIDGGKEYSARQLPNTNRFPTYVKYGSNPAVFGGGHTHTILLQTMFSGQDAVKQLYGFYNNFGYYEGGVKDASIPVNILATENATYALKIEDIEKLEAINNIFNDQKKYIVFCDEIAKKQKDLESSFATNNSENYEIEYLKTITNFQNNGYETGLALYKLFRESILINGTTRVVERWKKAVLTNNGTKIDFVPCEN